MAAWIVGISLASILGVLARPRGTPEWVWAMAGASALVAIGALSPREALGAAGRGADVYCFLLGMMLLSEQARAEGLFDWVARVATRRARGSATRLFALLYLVGIGVTVFLSNDATAVVLTPAVYAAVKRAGAKPAPYLFACALIANAASFALPISNPANLVVFGGELPPVSRWLAAFALPSLASIAVTYGVLRFWFRRDLREPIRLGAGSDAPSAGARWAAGGLAVTVPVLLAASALGWDLGPPTLVAAAATVAVIAVRKRKAPHRILRHLAWGVIPMVAGLFVIVEAANRVGALGWTREFLRHSGKFGAAFGVGIAANVVNNLPAGLIAGFAVRDPGIAAVTRSATMIGVDLGPNLSVAGSLATILWLIALRREGEPVSGWAFFRLGLVTMPLALAASLALLR